VNFARERGIPLSIKGGGHNISGLAVCDGGLMLDMSLMRGVWVDPTTRTARAQAGCLLGDVDRETQLHGLATVLGFISNTGIAGLTLGGGFGYITRRFGWSCDNVLSMDVVTADGRVLLASERENGDLEWARTAWQEMRRFSTGGTYINFLTEEEGEERIRAAYGKNYERLIEVKTKWDPENLFRMNKNIKPFDLRTDEF